MKNRIAICVPARDIVHASFCFDLANMIATHMVSGDAILPMTNEGTLLAAQRQELAENALEAGATHILWLDTDMRFPKDLLARLLEHDKDFVSVNCSKRKEPVGPTASDMDFEKIYPDPEVEGLQQVSMVGLAVALVKTNWLERMEKPWFDTPWYPEKGYHVGEDMYFCGRAQKVGVDLFIDHDLSWEVKHLGTKPYGMVDVMLEAERGDN
jgi:hypothetical protein